MEIVALVAVAFLQLASLSLDQLRETVQDITAALAELYADSAHGISVESGTLTDSTTK